MSLDQSKFVAVYSNDVNIVESVEGDSFLCYEKPEQLVEYSLKSTTSDVQSLPKSDAVIYDLDLADNDEARIIEDILHLKLNSRFKPLILVGEKELVKRLMQSEKIEPHVAKSIAKPINQTRLRFVVDALIAKQMVMMPAEKPANGALKFVALGSVATAFLGATLAFVLLNNEDANASIEGANVSQTLESQSNQAQAKNHLLASANADVQWLSEQASAARAQGKLAYPKNDNALYFYGQILAADLYNAEAYEGRKQILAQLRASLPGLLTSGDNETASNVVDALISAEPFRDDNRDLLALLGSAEKPLASTKIRKPVAKKPVSSSGNDKKFELRQANRVATPEPAPAPIGLASVKSVKSVRPVAKAAEKVAAEIQEPVLIKSIGPRYPKRAVRNSIEGWIEVAYQVDESGKPINVQVVKAQPEKIFDKSGINAVKEWQFEPAVDSRTGGAVISERATTKFRFNLDT